MDALKDKSLVKLRRMDNEYDEYLNTFLDHAFATFAVGHKNPCPCTMRVNQFHHEQEVVTGHLFHERDGC